MTNEDNRTPGRWSRTNNDETAATRRSAAAKTTRAASRVRATRVLQPIRTLPRQNTRSTKDEINNTKMMGALKKDGIPTYKIKMQQQGRENLWRTKEKRNEPEYKRQLQRMVRGAPHLPTSPELRLMIKLQPNLNPVQKSKKQVQLLMLQDTKKLTNETSKPATKLLQPLTYPTNKDEWDGATSQRVATSRTNVGQNNLTRKNNKPAREEVLPSVQKFQKGSVFVENETSKVEVVSGDKSSELESSLGTTDKVEIENEFKVLMERADAQAIELDKSLEEEAVRDLDKDLKEDRAEDMQLFETLEIELRGIECEFCSGLEVIDQRPQELKYKKELHLKDEATSESCSKGSGQQETATIHTSSPPIKPTETPIKLQTLTSNLVTPEAKKVPHFKTTTKLPKPTKNHQSGSPTKKPTKLPSNEPTKALRIVPTTNVNKPSTKQSTVFKTETNTSNSKPPKKPPDPRYNNQAGFQRVAMGAADDIMPGQSRSKVKYKGAALAQRVPGREKHDKQKDSARVQRVPGRELRGRDHNDPREGVLDTLQVSMHPNVGPDTDGTRTIMVPVIGY